MQMNSEAAVPERAEHITIGLGHKVCVAYLKLALGMHTD